LHALYRAEPLREALERAAERGVSSLQRILDDLPGCCALDEPRLDAFDVAWRAALTSVNTLDDLETLETLLFRAGA
jgi:molybdopterin-guanine dinucleotide biosynthesis protein A